MKKKLIAIVLAGIMLLACGCQQQTNNTAANNEAEVVADFVKHNIAINLKLGEAADYKTACKNDTTQTTVGKVKVTESKVYKNGDALPYPDMEAMEEYEWVQVSVQTVFEDQNAKDFGVNRASCVSNYYDLEYYELRLQEQDNGFTKFSVKVGDKAYNECLYKKVIDNQGWNTDLQSICNYTWFFRIPEGYDGMVIVFFNGGLNWEDGKYIYEVIDQDALAYRVEG